jgi:DNA-binding response OmpR family regulator/tRNA A-37 threonylcarbamoyl transferase component Bud32
MASLAPLAGDALAELRHELRTPVNHIMGYTEMLLEDVEDPSLAERRAALADTLSAARDVLDLINATLGPSRTEIERAEVVSLYASLREPQRKIVDTIGALLSAAGELEDAVVDDLKRILGAAERLVPVEHDRAVTEVSEQDTDPDPGPARILVVDDVEDNRDLLRRRLRRDGYQVECAENGRDALELISAQEFDLVLLDVLMPEVDGYEVLKRMKEAPATRDIPVIMISALDDTQNIVRCIERGAEDYLPKPFDAILLRARINACLEKKRLRDQEKEYLQQVSKVIEAATAVESGTYRSGTLAIVSQRADELGRLARVFDGMAQHVRDREEKLRGRVRELRMEIDAAQHAPREAEAALDHGTLSPGDRFADRYEVMAVVGTGAMGTVYRARDLELDEEVAIKALRPELVSNAKLVERFKGEIRLARRISHRNVVRTHDFGEWAGMYYLTMEYVEGITVRELIDTRNRLRVPAALAIAAQLAQSLAVAHEMGVIHRDIKPQNLVLDADGTLKVMDFGVARLAERTSTLTEAGLVVGTPAYMPPEQLLAESVDQRSDLYAAGVVLYECLTGRLPYDALTTISLIAKLLSEEPPAPTDLNAEIPPALSALILELLAKKPEDRVQTAVQLVERLSQIT